MDLRPISRTWSNLLSIVARQSLNRSKLVCHDAWRVCDVAVSLNIIVVYKIYLWCWKKVNVFKCKPSIKACRHHHSSISSLISNINLSYDFLLNHICYTCWVVSLLLWLESATFCCFPYVVLNFIPGTSLIILYLRCSNMYNHNYLMCPGAGSCILLRIRFGAPSDLGFNEFHLYPLYLLFGLWLSASC